MFTAEELLPIQLTLELAAITTVFLLIVATPLAWWLAKYKVEAEIRSEFSGDITSCFTAQCIRFLSFSSHGAKWAFG